MRIESVTAVAFGPFKGVTLEFSPQLTVVCGPNEAGKSSWHAAIYASLCGMRRARGQLAQDRDFARLRRPWSGEAWEVRAIVRLDNGRRVELRQDLSDLARCSAIDADFGRDVAAEILNEGTPDATRWLGLDRRSFLAVACVRQGEIQKIIENAGSLQDELQRAAASAVRDSTAAEAISRLQDFQREQVGQDTRNSTKPLRRAKIRVEQAETALTNAREKHSEWLALEVHARRLAENAGELNSKLRVLRALRARREAESWHTRLERARRLAAAHPGGAPALAPDDALADEVASALSLWSSRPKARNLAGPSAAEIRAEIEKLPQAPSGDQIPRSSVLAAMKAYERAIQALQLHQAHRPSATPARDANGFTADRLRDLARDLETVVPAADPGLEAAHQETQRHLREIRGSQLHRSLIGGFAVVALLGGVALWASWNHWIGVAFAICGIAALLWVVLRSRDQNGELVFQASLKIEAQLLAQRKAMEDACGKVNAARAQIVAAGLPVNPIDMRELADGLVLADRHRQLQEDWDRNDEKLQSELTKATEEFARALVDAGASNMADLTAAFEAYEQACRSRAQQAERASARDALNRQLADREAAEQAAADAQAQRSGAERKMTAAMAACGLDARDPEAASDALRRWQDERKARLVNFDLAAREYSELMALLDGGTLEGLETRAAEAQRAASTLAAEAGTIPQIGADVNLDQEILATEQLLHDALLASSAADARARDRALFVPSIAEAEESLASAQQELERVTRLSETLALTLDFLQKAEERVHRDIAPRLAAGLRQWLPVVTQRRYSDARVDPSDLCVRVLGPDNEWREAHQLSHGTAEQIYLLLRIVLAERLAITGETCPLILDDVLVQSDAVRKRALLDTIVSISQERQMILFTQEDEVLHWAQANVVVPNRVVVLPPPS